MNYLLIRVVFNNFYYQILAKIIILLSLIKKKKKIEKLTSLVVFVYFRF